MRRYCQRLRVFRLSELLNKGWSVEKLVEDIKTANSLKGDKGKWLIQVSCEVNDKYISTETVEGMTDEDLDKLVPPAWRLLLRSAKDKSMKKVELSVVFRSDTYVKEISENDYQATNVIDDKKSKGLVEFYERVPGVSVIKLNKGYLSS